MTSYQEIRAASKTMQVKALDVTKNLDFNAVRMAKRLTLRIAGRTLIFDNETIQNAFFDFWFHEYRVNGKSLVESVDSIAAGLLPAESEILTGHLQSRTSLFEAVGVLPLENKIRLKDFLAPESPDVWLTDLGLSDSMKRTGARVAMFCRIISVHDISMTSGFSFLFNPQRIPGLLQGVRQKTKKVAPADLAEARFVFFFQKYREFGEEQIYQDVV